MAAAVLANVLPPTEAEANVRPHVDTLGVCTNAHVGVLPKWVKGKCVPNTPRSA